MTVIQQMLVASMICHAPFPNRRARPTQLPPRPEPVVAEVVVYTDLEHA